MKIKVTVSTRRVGSQAENEIEIDESELEDLTGEERETVIEDMARDAMFEMIEWDFVEIENGEK